MSVNNERPRLQLLEWRRVDKGALIGRAQVRLPIGLEISDIGVFEKAGRWWAQLPAEIMRDFATGSPLTDAVTGRARYKSSLRWSTKLLQDGFSEAVIAAVEAEHGPLGGAAT